MSNPWIRTTVLICALLGGSVATSCEDAAAPAHGPGPGRVELTPDLVMLWLDGPQDTMPLNVVAKDAGGATIAMAESIITFSSSAPTVARVSDGVLIARSPGTARITATVKSKGVTGSAQATVTVREGRQPEIAGVYHLTSFITDPGMYGWRVTARLDLQRVPGTSLLTGSYASLEWTRPDGDWEWTQRDGTVGGVVRPDGQVDIILLSGWDGLTRVWQGEATLSPESLTGTFVVSTGWEDVTGSFTALRDFATGH